MRTTVLLSLLAVLFSGHQASGPAPAGEEALKAALGEAGISFAPRAGLVAVPAEVLVREDLLEYMLVGPNGATHESLLKTTVSPALLNAALVGLGVERGVNARWAEDAVQKPVGDGFLLYCAWREDEEVYFFRVDDLVSNLGTGRSMRRHRWVYLGSRFASLSPGKPEVFIAATEENLINLCFFYQGNTLLTASLPECVDQTIWVANSWLLPERGTPLTLIFSRDVLTSLPADLEANLPAAAGGDAATEGRPAEDDSGDDG